MEEAASQLERDHVHSVYDKIAPYFNDNRYKAWPKVRQFLLDLPPGSIVADIGCGNGKYLHINKDVFKLGCDVCRPLVDFAWSQGHEVQMCDGLHLPYRDGCFDAVLSIAVIHHLSTKERRIRAIKEMARTLRVGGCIMIYVWAMEQKRRKFEKQDIFIPWNPNPHVPSHSGKDDGKPRRAAAQSASDAADNSKKHRKVRSTSSVADQGDLTPTAPQQKTQRLWFFSRSLDSVFDFGSLAISWPSSKDLSTLSSPTGENDGSKVNQRGRGRRLIKQVSSFFSPPSTIGSEEDVFDLGQNDAQGKSPAPYSSTETQSVSVSLVQECGPLALPDLISLQELPKHSAGESNQELQESTSPAGSGKQAESSCLRYYHVFREGELAELIESHVEELRVKHAYFDHANWCVVAEKV
ncbi:putative tRNA methyltransferase 9-like protein [Oryzias melastigma]|uniref:Putative tRNA methyltransferase 9-like protein n=1 Tax=Oryzias melastigma TaxID=30732 RepID=A0A3B3B8S8_ORYME|nr:probable tRNA methyltransferase 9B [Oryzias melastigma]XP_024133713.1 probable tRNA methyltransferase 9B [Oryzias melastigma]KAF6724939.1 putative tRNA methyltransferase 9-like protein [Oryzias melastigma]